MPITALPSLDRTSATFRADVDLFFGTKLPAFVTEANAQAAAIIAAGLLSGEAVAAAAAAQAAADDATAAAAAVGVAVDWANNIFAAGTRIPFAQPTAPTGWVQDTSDKAINRMLRVVNTVGNNVGGAHSPILNNVVPSHTHGFTTGTVSADHSHAIGDPGHAHSLQSVTYVGSGGTDTGDYANSNTQNNGNVPITNSSATGVWTGSMSANHTHSGGTDNGSSQTSWAPRYIDMIICTKN